MLGLLNFFDFFAPLLLDRRVIIIKCVVPGKPLKIHSGDNSDVSLR